MSYTVPFSQLTKANIPAAGGKGANLGELTTAGLPVPAGFVLTTGAYDAFAQAHGLPRQIVDLAHTVSADDPQSSAAASEQIRALFIRGVIADGRGRRDHGCVCAVDAYPRPCGCRSLVGNG